MQIKELKVINPSNIFSVREPIVKIQVKLGNLQRYLQRILII